MRVAEVMSRGIDLVAPGASVQDAAVRMAEEDVGAVLIGSEQQAEGILTDRDIILRLVVEGRSPAAVQVREIMSAPIFSCDAADTLESAFQAMAERQIRRLVVLDENGAAIGIVTLGDLARVMRHPDQISELLRDAAEPHRDKTRPEPE